MGGGRDLFSARASRTNRAIVEEGGCLPLEIGTVERMAVAIGADLEGVEVVMASDEIDYLDAQGACVCTPTELGGRQIRLGPASFEDEEALARTIVHELVHVRQLRNGVIVASDEIEDLEAEAYDAEGAAVRTLEEMEP